LAKKVGLSATLLYSTPMTSSDVQQFDNEQGEGAANKHSESISHWVTMIGKNLRQLRKERGWLQQDAALKLGITVKHYSQMERDKAHPSSTLLQKIAALFEVEVRDLYDFRPRGEEESATAPAQEPSRSSIVEVGPGKRRLLFKDLAPRLAYATASLTVHLDRLDDGQVEQALRCSLDLIQMAETIRQEENTNARSA
jgi:transcriptional regulator with XRE-family HTH domain